MICEICQVSWSCRGYNFDHNNISGTASFWKKYTLSFLGAIFKLTICNDWDWSDSLQSLFSTLGNPTWWVQSEIFGEWGGWGRSKSWSFCMRASTQCLNVKETKSCQVLRIGLLLVRYWTCTKYLNAIFQKLCASERWLLLFLSRMICVYYLYVCFMRVCFWVLGVGGLLLELKIVSFLFKDIVFISSAFLLMI